MKEIQVLGVVNNIFKSIFNSENKNSLDELLEKFAFDIKLPKQVNDSTTNEVTWADSINSGRFITNKNMEAKDIKEGWMLPKKEIKNFRELLDIWKTINLTTTERVYDSINVSKSDTIYRCENIYRCTDCSDSKNLIYCDSCGESEFLIASQRSTTCNYCIRVDDSNNCSNSYNVICSTKIVIYMNVCFAHTYHQKDIVLLICNLKKKNILRLKR